MIQFNFSSELPNSADKKIKNFILSKESAINNIIKNKSITFSCSSRIPSLEDSLDKIVYNVNISILFNNFKEYYNDAEDFDDMLDELASILNAPDEYHIHDFVQNRSSVNDITIEATSQYEFHVI